MSDCRKILAQFPAQGPCNADTHTGDRRGILNSKTSAAAVASGKKSRNWVQILIKDLLVVIRPQAIHCDHRPHGTASGAIRHHGIVGRGIQRHEKRRIFPEVLISAGIAELIVPRHRIQHILLVLSGKAQHIGQFLQGIRSK